MSLNVTFAAGNILTAAHMNGLQAAWDSYTPTWTTSAGAPAIGNGTLTGKWNRVGKTIDVRIELVAGSTTTYGTAGSSWRFTLPVAPLSTKRHRWLGTAYDSGVGDYTVHARYVTAGPYIELVAPPTTAGGADRLVTDTVPFTWGAADELLLQLRYESA